jgi:hypothetical protein
MAVIKITHGGCGIKYTDANGNPRHALKTPEHGPFECDAAQAGRLVSLGVAEYVQQSKAAAPANDAAQDPETQDDGTITGHLATEQLESMTVEQLKNLAGDLGIDVTGCKKKAELVEAIAAVEVEAGGEVDPDDLPDLDAADPE